MKKNNTLTIKLENNSEFVLFESIKKKLTMMTRATANGRTVWVEKDRFFNYIISKDSYQIPAQLMNELANLISEYGIPVKDIHYTDNSGKKYTNVIKHSYKCEFTPRDEQQFFIDGMTNQAENTLVAARTGFGKTYMASKLIASMGVRTLIYIKPTYISKWKRDIHTYFNVDKDKVFVIKGSDTLMKLLTMPKEERLKLHFIIASNTTMLNYFNKYADSATGENEYPIQPNDFLDELEIGLMLSDESHQFFRNLYIAVTSLAPAKFIGLSATLLTLDAKLRNVHNILFPLDSRLDLTAYKQYAFATAVFYRMSVDERAIKNGMFGYNVKKYEGYILKRPNLLRQWFEMIDEYVGEHYTSRKLGGEKLLIYASGLGMIQAMYHHFRKKFNSLKVYEYKGGKNYDEMLEADVIISSFQMVGTAIDIPHLLTVINTTNVNEPAGNLQAVGRLRELPNREVRYIQFVNMRVNAHRNYHATFRKFIEPTLKELTTTEYKKHLTVY